MASGGRAESSEGTEAAQHEPRLPCQVAGWPIHTVASPAELKAVCHLRFEVYVGELKRDNYSYVDPVEQLLEDPLDHSDSCINIFHSTADDGLTEVEQETGYVKPLPGQRVVSGARVHVPCPDKYTAMFSTNDPSVFGEELVSDQRNFAFFSRFMVHQGFRRVRSDGFGLADALYASAFDAVRARGAKIMLLNCTPALSPYYERFGFVRYKPAYCDDGMGLQIPLAMPLEDVNFLQRVAPKSPLTLTALSLGRVSGATDGQAEAEPEPEGDVAEVADAPALSCHWLVQVQSHRAPPLVNYMTIDGIEGMRRFLNDEGQVPDMGEFSIFAGVGPDERAAYFGKVPSALCVIDIPAGAQLTREGDVRDEAYLLLSGTMENTEHPGEVLEPGVVVGEVSFLSVRTHRFSAVRQLSEVVSKRQFDPTVLYVRQGSQRISTTVCKTDCLVMVVSRIGFMKSMKVVPEIAVKLLWNLGTGLSRRFMQQTTQLKKTAHLLQTAIASEADDTNGHATKRALSEVATQLETTAQLNTKAAPPTTPNDPTAKWRKVQEAGFAAIRRVNSAPTRGTGVIES